jgi:type VI secretion system protein ImpG
MSASIDEKLLDYYQRELGYLRQAGGEFAASYPKIAHRLALSEYECPDPHVERLLECFAFLSAKLNRKLDDDYTQFSNALLEQLYPHAIRPLPVTAIARFTPDPAKGNLAEGYHIPRHTPLFATTGTGDTIYFRTTVAQTLWPLQISAAHLLGAEHAQALSGLPQARSALKLTLECLAPHQWPALPAERLCIHLAGSAVTSAALYDLLAAHSIGPLRPEPLGFGADERLLPEEGGVDPVYSLLPEYFACPEKFLFFDLRLPDRAERANATTHLDVIIPFDREPTHQISLQTGDIALGCVSVINLFPRTSEPLRPDGTRSEYLLLADAHRRHSTEIYRVCEVRAGQTGKATIVPPYFSAGHGHAAEGLYWHARRVHRPLDRSANRSGNRSDKQSDGPSGSDILLTLIDSQFDPANPGKDSTVSLSAQLLCTNGALAAGLPAGCPLSFETPGPVANVRLLRQPRRPNDTPLSGSSRWRLVSQLSLNHLSLGEGPQALAALREMLALHNLGVDPAVQQQISGIQALDNERITSHVGQDAWRGWRNGLQLTLTLNPDNFAGSSPVLFAGVLAHFFARYASTNRFIRTVLRLHDREISPWQPQVGSPLAL